MRKYQKQFDALRYAAAQGARISTVDPYAATDRVLAPDSLNAVAVEKTKPLMGSLTQPNLKKRQTLPIQSAVTRQERQKTILRAPLTVGLMLLALSAISFGFMRWQQKQGQGLPVVRASEIQQVLPDATETAKSEGASDATGEALPLAKALSSMSDAIEADAIALAPSAPAESPTPRVASTRPSIKMSVAQPAARKAVVARPPSRLAEKKAESQAKKTDRDEDSKKQKASKEKDRDRDSAERIERYAIRNAYRYGSAFDGPMRFGPAMRSECRQRRR